MIDLSPIVRHNSRRNIPYLNAQNSSDQLKTFFYRHRSGTGFAIIISYFHTFTHHTVVILEYRGVEKKKKSELQYSNIFTILVKC